MKSGFRTILAATLGAFGLGAGHSVAAASSSARTIAVAKASEQSSREIVADQIGGSILRGLFRNNGTPPDVWGRSRACARMVARNRALAAGRRR